MENKNINEIEKLNKRMILVMELIEKNMFEEAENILQSLPEITEIRCIKKLEYIKNIIEEKKVLHNLKTTEKGLKIFNYLKQLEELLENNKYEEALNISREAYKNTKNSLFMYYLGLCFLKLDNLVEAAQNFRFYKTLGTLKTIQANEYLIQINGILAEDFDEKYLTSMTAKRSQTLLDKCSSLEAENKLINEIYEGKFYVLKQQKPKAKVKIELEDEEIKELLNNGKVNSVVEIFENEEEYNRKITILALLYINGFSTSADKLLSKNRKAIKENCPKELKLLENNKKLYIAKSK